VVNNYYRPFVRGVFEKMGKSTKSRKSKVARDDPIGLDSAVIELELKAGDIEGGKNQPENVDNMMAQLQSVNPEDRVCGCHSLARLSLASPEFRQVALDRKVARICGPLALDTDPMVRLAALGALNNLSGVDPDVAEILVEQDIMTPLTAMMSTFYPPDWTPNITNKKIDMLSNCLSEALGLLWNLVESSQSAVNMFNNHNLVHTVLRYLDITVYPITLVQASLSVLAAVCDNNLPASEVVLSRETNLLSILQSDNISMLARVTSGVVLLNIHRSDIYNQTGSLAGIASTVTQCLNKDARQMVCQYSSSSPLDENEEMETEADGDKSEDVDMKECREVMKSQSAALEVIVNLTGLDDAENDWVDEEENMSDENDESFDEHNDSVKISEANPAFIEIVVANNLVESILSKANDVPENVRDILVSSSRGRKLYEQFQELRTRALLCVSCLSDNLTKSDLGGIERLQQIWTELGRLCFSPEVSGEGEFVEAASGAMRSVTRRICSESPEEARQLVGVIGAEDLAGMMATYSNSQSSGVRVNIVNILGDVAGLAATNIKVPACSQVLSQLVTWMEETGARDQDLRVVAESLDKLMDVLSEDDSDELFAQMKLLAKLKQLLPSVKVKMEQQKKSLGDNFPIVKMAKTNLQRFIKYKEKRPLIAMSR